MNKCACRFVVNARNTLAPTVKEYQRGRIEFCGLHASARELLGTLRELLARVNVRIDDPRIEIFDKARRAIEKAEEKINA